MSRGVAIRRLWVLRAATLANIALATCVGCAPPPAAPAAAAPPPAAPPPAAPVTGRLPPEQIQRLVRKHFGVFRDCYGDGLRRNPALEGRVSVRFVIARDGSVEGVTSAGSDIPDADVVACVVKGFRTLHFPQPEGGIVTVTYPIMFSPGEPKEGPLAPVATGPFKGCQASRGEDKEQTVASILCDGYKVSFGEAPGPLTASDAEKELDGQARGLRPGLHQERVSVTLAGVGAWGLVVEEPGKVQSTLLLVPVGTARRRSVLCVARPPTPTSVAACEQAITVLASTATFAEAVPPP